MFLSSTLPSISLGALGFGGGTCFASTNRIRLTELLDGGLFLFLSTTGVSSARAMRSRAGMGVTGRITHSAISISCQNDGGLDLGSSLGVVFRIPFRSQNSCKRLRRTQSLSAQKVVRAMSVRPTTVCQSPVVGASETLAVVAVIGIAAPMGSTKHWAMSINELTCDRDRLTSGGLRLSFSDLVPASAAPSLGSSIAVWVVRCRRPSVSFALLDVR
eukprot:g18970.t1